MDEQSGGLTLPIEIAYRRPRWLLPYLIITPLAATVCVLIADLAWPLALLLAMTALLLAVQGAGRVLHDQTGIVLDIKDRWFVSDAPGRGRAARLVSATVSLPGFIVLVLQTDDRKRYSFILTSIEQPVALMRRLRVRLYYPLGEG